MAGGGKVCFFIGGERENRPCEMTLRKMPRHRKQQQDSGRERRREEEGIQLIYMKSILKKKKELQKTREWPKEREGGAGGS